MFLEAILAEDAPCYQYLYEVAHHIILPKCDSVTEQVIHPYREMCWDFVEGCWQKYLDFLARMDSQFRYVNRNHLGFMSSAEKSQIIDCDYLPPLHGSVPCFYKPVTCESPPGVTNGTNILNITQKDIYQLHDVIQYTCANEAFQLRGNSATMCQYSGEWSHPPPRCIGDSNSPLHPFNIVLPILILSLIIYVSLVFRAWYSKVKLQNLTRNRQYDAFVCYSYDFAEKIIPKELEEEFRFNLHIHRRDFKAGWDIKWNIMNAIRNSSSAIIIMS